VNSICVVVPAYEEEGRIGGVVQGIQEHCPHVIVVDDGSSDGTAEEARRAGAEVLRHEINRGKGAALETAFKRVRERGFQYVITMDADGQHAPSDIPAFVNACGSGKVPVLIGNRMAEPRGMPIVRRLTNRFMSRLLSREMGQDVPDTQNGYRLYRCDVLECVSVASERYAAESEILLELAAAGVRMGSVPVRVIYRDEQSKINPLKDTLRFFGMLKRHRKRHAGCARPGKGANS
jgi:glycosyltransferase involved in cell wall biosynthesis